MAHDATPVERPLRAPAGARMAVVVSEFHRELTGAMLASARATLTAAGLAEDDLEVVWVPGAFELPLVARRLARRDDVQAVLCFGLVLKGETTHDHWVAHAATEGLMKVGLETDTPVLFGVLTCDTLEQARARAATRDAGGLDKGGEVARAALGVLAALTEARGSAARR